MPEERIPMTQEERMNKLVADGNKFLDKAIKKYTQLTGKLRYEDNEDYVTGEIVSSSLSLLNQAIQNMNQVVFVPKNEE